MSLPHPLQARWVPTKYYGASYDEANNSALHSRWVTAVCCPTNCTYWTCFAYETFLFALYLRL